LNIDVNNRTWNKPKSDLTKEVSEAQKGQDKLEFLTAVIDI
jgi:hypothetical protein